MNSLEQGAEVAAQITVRFDKTVVLIVQIDDGDPKYWYYFSAPSDQDLATFLDTLSFSHQRQQWSPKDADADIFVNDKLETRMEFWDPIKNSDKPLSSNIQLPVPAFTAYQRALACLRGEEQR